MKILGFFLLLAGCFLVFAATVLLGSKELLPAFVVAGIGVELAGLIIVARAFAHSANKY